MHCTFLYEITLYRRVPIIYPEVTTAELKLGSNEGTEQGTLLTDNDDIY